MNAIEKAQAERAEVTKRIGMLRFRIAHPERYVKSGKYSRDQRASLKSQLEAALEARAKLDGTAAGSKRKSTAAPAAPRLARRQGTKARDRVAA